MTPVRRAVAVLSAVAALALLPAPAAQATVTAPSGAYADTTLVCMRGVGAYVVSRRGAGFHYVRGYLLNSRSGPVGWTGWDGQVYGDASVRLPTTGTVAVYLQYAAWNGWAWEFAGEWAKVYNARGEHVSYWC